VILLVLFKEFFKTGLFSVGGGLATLPFLREMTQRYDWFSMKDLMDMIAISESTPGPIGVNMSTFAGYNAAGVLGGITATLSLVFPSILVIIAIAYFMQRFQSSLAVQRGFYALRAATAGLIAGAMFEVVVLSLFNVDLFRQTGRLLSFFRLPALLLFGLLIILIKRFPKVHPIAFILGSAVIGIIFKL